MIFLKMLYIKLKVYECLCYLLKKYYVSIMKKRYNKSDQINYNKNYESGYIIIDKKIIKL